MAVRNLSLLAACLLLAACAAGARGPVEQGSAALVKGPLATEGIELFAPCDREQAEKLADLGAADPKAALEAANCYASLARAGESAKARGEDAALGRAQAELAAKAAPESGPAHYLAAYLAGLEAENNPGRGLDLVPVIEQEALRASELDPGMDHAGPDRMLGELYLRAPGFPVSIGDPAEAVSRFEQAVKLAPGHADNRLGLAEALLKEDEPGRACQELARALDALAADSQGQSLKRAGSVLTRVCGELGEN